jgi:hypothetical protein
MGISDQSSTKPGPSNPHNPGGQDAPTPPGGPLRQDAADGPDVPGGPSTPTQPGEPQQVDPDPGQPAEGPTVQPSSNPDGPATIPAPGTPQGEPGPDDQLANAQTSQGQPSSAVD